MSPIIRTSGRSRQARSSIKHYLGQAVFTRMTVLQSKHTIGILNIRDNVAESNPPSSTPWLSERVNLLPKSALWRSRGGREGEEGESHNAVYGDVTTPVNKQVQVRSRSRCCLWQSARCAQQTQVKSSNPDSSNTDARGRTKQRFTTQAYTYRRQR